MITRKQLQAYLDASDLEHKADYAAYQEKWGVIKAKMDLIERAIQVMEKEGVNDGIYAMLKVEREQPSDVIDFSDELDDPDFL